MMKYVFLAASVLMIAACGGGAGEKSKSDSANLTTQMQNIGGTAVDSAQNMGGSNLIAANDCLTCHQIDKKGFGPSYRQIANRYENNQGNIENLAHKIRYGGKGLWGNNAMTPHSEVSNTQAEEMATYILSLRDTTK